MAAVVCSKIVNVKCFSLLICVHRLKHLNSTILLRTLSTFDDKKKKVNNSSYSKTVLLPRTKFPLWLDPRRRVDHDANVLKQCEFFSLYQWQRDNLTGEEFILHDGPPYANGSPHVGHAVNKILKDIIMRRNMLLGHRIHYIPGWDCHGLPIELKSSKDIKGTSTPVEIRVKARDFAKRTIDMQRSIFQSWGVLGDWDRNCYHTYDKGYVKNQLHQFYELFRKGLIYQDMKPVYWSPSSRTALAEAELEYNEEHKSKCVTLRVLMVSPPVGVICDGPLYALIWTTTPWTLPANEAIAFRSDFQYSIVQIEGFEGFYIIASNVMSRLEKELSRNIKVTQSIAGSGLKSATYRHPFHPVEVHCFFEADFVSDSKGTGLVHIAPAHGREDYVVAVANKLPIVSLVNEDGNYTGTAGSELAGKSIFGDGLDAVYRVCSSDIVHSSEIVHSYPYDWRTKKPVIMLSSKQWFFNCEAVKEAAARELGCVNFLPHERNGLQIMVDLVKKRPFWCISRQRVWGVPIPVLHKRECKTPLVSKSLIEHYCTLIDKHGTDFWWILPLEELCPQMMADELNVDLTEIECGSDILDIWFDSGLSWSSVLKNRTADLCLEGMDQFTGWFQSSLLTSVALVEKPPYKTVFTHGFVVDEEGHKMSKSLGNVINPNDITCGGKDQPAYGVDTLRWWVAAHSVQHTNIPIGNNLIKMCSENVHKIRSVVRYALGTLADYPGPEHGEQLPTFLLDKYMLHVIHDRNEQVQKYYAEFKFNLVCSSVLDFVVNDLSALYCTLTKDRLYCDSADSINRRLCQFVMFQSLDFILYNIAPVTPLLVEEAYLHHPCFKGKQFFKSKSQDPFFAPAQWNRVDIVSALESALLVKKAISRNYNGILWGCSAAVNASSEIVAHLQPLVDDQLPTHCQLADILQVGSVTLGPLPENKINDSQLIQVSVTPLNVCICNRCRRHSVLPGCDTCQRCSDVLSGIVQNATV